MKLWTSTVTVEIWGHKNAWSLSMFAGASPTPTTCEVVVEIKGDRDDGYYLVTAPNGFNKADSWHESPEEAFTAAQRLLGLKREDWKRAH